MSNTLVAIMQELAKRHPDLGRLGTISAATAVTEFQSNQFYGVRNRDLVLMGAPVYVDYDAGGADAAPQGEEVYVSKAPGPSDNTVGIVPSLSVALAASDTIQMWHPDLQGVDRIKECVNRALTLYCHRWVLMPVTMLPDGDMQKPGVADWTSSGSPTVLKTAGPEGDPVRQSLGVSAGTAAYAYQNYGRVQQTQNWSVAALVRGGTAGARIALYDGTTPVTLTGDGGAGTGTVGSLAWEVLRNTFTIPTACYRIGVRLYSSTGLLAAQYSWVVLQNQDVNEIVLPDRVTDVEAVGRVFRAPRRISDPLEPPFSWGLEEVTDIERFSTRGTGGVTLRFPCKLGSDLWFYEERQPYEALETDDATTEAPLDWLVEATALEAYRIAYLSWRAGSEQRAPVAGMPVADPNPWRYALQMQQSRVEALQRNAVGEPQIIVRR